MNEHPLPGSGNSLVGSRDDGEPTYRELIRCNHCLQPMSNDDALDECCDECVGQVRLPWFCNSCDHDWECMGIPLRCPSCQSYNLNSHLSIRLDMLRETVVEQHLRKLLEDTHHLEQAIKQFK